MSDPGIGFNHARRGMYDLHRTYISSYLNTKRCTCISDPTYHRVPNTNSPTNETAIPIQLDRALIWILHGHVDMHTREGPPSFQPRNDDPTQGPIP
jgi:hypothetical protein